MGNEKAAAFRRSTKNFWGGFGKHTNSAMKNSEKMEQSTFVIGDVCVSRHFRFVDRMVTL